MPDHEPPLAAFLAGDLDPATARAVDEHLLSCDQCWLAVREDRAGLAIANSLREPADPQLADRIRLAVELASPAPAAPPPTSARWPHSATAAVTGVAALLLTLVTVLALIPRQAAPPTGDSAAMRQVVALARGLRPIASASARAAVALNRPRTLQTDAQSITVQTYAFHGDTALVATATTRPFTMPADAHMPTARAMPWTVTRGANTVYCPRADVLLAGPETTGWLAALAHALHLT
ncbi:MAG: zf-HC2 domain-containing protein [Mycobacteriales bacterium]